MSFETTNPRKVFCSLRCQNLFHSTKSNQVRYARRIQAAGAVLLPEDEPIQLVESPAIQPKAAVEPTLPPLLPVSCPSCDAPTPAGDYCHACMSIILSGGDDWSAL